MELLWFGPAGGLQEAQVTVRVFRVRKVRRVTLAGVLTLRTTREVICRWPAAGLFADAAKQREAFEVVVAPQINLVS